MYTEKNANLDDFIFNCLYSPNTMCEYVFPECFSRYMPTHISFFDKNSTKVAHFIFEIRLITKLDPVHYT